MKTLTNRSQFQARAISQGRHKLAPAHQEIMDWITKQFGVTGLDFSCEKRQISKFSSQQVVHVILATADDVKRLQEDRAGNSLIAERFLKYFRLTDSTQNYDPLKSNAFPPETDPFPDIIVTWRPLKDIDSETLKEMWNEEKREILETFKSVWTISQTVVFYYTDQQLKENMANGTSTKIADELEQADRKHGFAAGYPYRFDSKESFDRDYQGNWHYYWQ